MKDGCVAEADGIVAGEGADLGWQCNSHTQGVGVGGSGVQVSFIDIGCWR